MPDIIYNTLINFKRGTGLNSNYATIPLFSELHYSTNIVGELSVSTVVGDDKPWCEPWFDKGSKQLWVDKQVINPKIIADTTEGHTGIEVGDVYWDQYHGATLKLGLDQSVLPSVQTNELITGTSVTDEFSQTTNTETARYNPHTNTVEAPYNALNSIYFGNGLLYTVINGVGVLTCDLIDTFVSGVDYDDTTHMLTLTLNNAVTSLGGNTLEVDLGSLITGTHAPAYGKIQTGNSVAVTDVVGNTATAEASVSNEKLTLKGGNKWVHMKATNSASENLDEIEIGHALSSVTPVVNTVTKKTTVKEYTYDEAGHVTGETTYDIDYDNGIVDTYYNALRTLRDNFELEAGRKYRIVDYETTTAQPYTHAAGHSFDLIVEAISNHELAPEAHAVVRSGETYFPSNDCDLSRWQIWYDLDNDDTKYAWADVSEGTGVIYRMIDEWGNDCPYDFKNIQFERKLTNGMYDENNGIDTLVYTFSAYDMDNTETVDASAVVGKNSFDDNTQRCFGNIINNYHIGDSGADVPILLNNNVFLNIYSVTGELPFDCSNNILGVNCFNNTFGSGCSDNMFYANAVGNTIGDYCVKNIFEYNVTNCNIGTSCSRNIIGSSCYNIVLGTACLNNIIDSYCTNFNINSSCRDNSFMTNCNNISFGITCCNNVINNDCSYIRLGNNCYNNIIENGCESIKFGDNNGAYGDYTNNVTVKSGNKNIRLYKDGVANLSNALQNIYIAQGVNMTNTYLNIDTIERALQYRTTVGKESNGTLRIYNEDDVSASVTFRNW